MAMEVEQVKLNNCPENTVFANMSMTEEMGRLYEIRLELVREQEFEDLAAADFLGENLSIKMTLAEDEFKWFTGFVTEFSQAGRSTRTVKYKVVLRPWLWFLTRTSDCRVFQNMTAPQIIDEILMDNDFTEFSDETEETYPDRPYTVQYNETDFDFISRLMEEEGIYYWFRHHEHGQEMILCDSLKTHESISGYEEIPFACPDAEDEEQKGAITSWMVSDSILPGACALNDYDFENPSTDLLSKVPMPGEHPYGEYEIYEYPGNFLTLEDGEARARTRINEIKAPSRRIKAETQARGLDVGRIFNLVNHPSEPQNAEHLIVSASYAYTDPSMRAYDEPGFTMMFEAAPTAERYYTPRMTPKPHIRGPQTAVVVGKEDEEIWTDQFGRVKIQFHWDRYGESDENSSCWVRVSQAWAGKSWGAIAIPRIGQEVIVEFLDGDPDRPIITGSVYNQELMPPYGLPDNATQSGVKTRSSKEGDGETFNELRFEDKVEEEEVYFHAEKDFNRVVENNDTLKVGFEKQEDGDQAIEVFNNQDVTIGDSECAEGNQTIKVWKDQTVEVGSDEVPDAKQTIDVWGDRTITVHEGAETLEVMKGDRTITVGEGAGALTVSQGDYSLTVDLGAITIEAMKSIELKVGESSIKLEPTAITIASVQVDIKGDAMATLKGAIGEVSADGALTLSGGVININ
jgi:type VI secretion system secreted protein VgrG